MHVYDVYLKQQKMQTWQSLKAMCWDWKMLQSLSDMIQISMPRCWWETWPAGLEEGYELQCNAITNVVWLLEFSKKCQFWFSNISELENHQFQFLEETNQNQRTTWSSYVKNLKEPVVFMKELVKTSGFMASFFFPAFLKTVVIYQNWVFDFLELWLWILRTALITTGGLFPFLITAQHCNYHDVLFVEGTLGGCASLVLFHWDGGDLWFSAAGKYGPSWRRFRNPTETGFHCQETLWFLAFINQFDYQPALHHGF